MTDNTLHLYFTDPDRPDIEEDKMFVISERLSNEDDWFTRFSELNISQESIFSYDLFWPHLVLSSRGNLLTYAKSYSILVKHIESEDITQIISHDFKKGYRLVIEDVAEEYGLKVEHRQRKRDNLRSIPNILLKFSVVLLFIDQMLSIIKERLPSSTTTLQHRPLFFPYPARYESMLPIIREIECPSNIVVTPLTISWRLVNPISDWPETHKTYTLSEFSDLSTIKTEFTQLFRLQKTLLTNGLELSQKVDEQLRNEYDVQLSRTVEYVCQDTLHRNIRLVLSLYLIENAIEETNPASVVVGGMNPRDRYVLEVGKRTDADLYYVPHSIAYSNEIVPQIAETTHFVAGEADKRVLQNQYSDEQLPDIQPLGRPYLDNLVELRDGKSKSDEKQRIILGTQPYVDWMREKFVNDVLEVVAQLEYQGDVLIKIHPSETPEYYGNIVEKNDYSFNIRVEQGDITSYITRKTSLITVNSNVGIEAVLAGAFCISYNPFEPFTQPSSYIDGEHVPYTTTPIELQRQLETVLPAEAKANEKQIQYVKEAFNMGDSIDKLSNHIGRV